MTGTPYPEPRLELIYDMHVDLEPPLAIGRGKVAPGAAEFRVWALA
jgi:hypothetical protein